VDNDSAEVTLSGRFMSVGKPQGHPKSLLLNISNVGPILIIVPFRDIARRFC